jgi:pimeloyl-ACP methyl ester carboxylesterase
VLAEAPHVSVETPRCPQAVADLARRIDASPDLQAALARDHGNRWPDVVARWVRRWQDPGFWRWDVSGALAQVICPVLVVHGADDPFFSAAHSQRIAGGVANGQLWLLAGAGHAPHLEASEQFVERALAFLQQPDDVAASRDAGEAA